MKVNALVFIPILAAMFALVLAALMARSRANAAEAKAKQVAMGANFAIKVAQSDWLDWQWPVSADYPWSDESYDPIEFPTLEEARSEHARAVVERA